MALLSLSACGSSGGADETGESGEETTTGGETTTEGSEAGTAEGGDGDSADSGDGDSAGDGDGVDTGDGDGADTGDGDGADSGDGDSGGDGDGDACTPMDPNDLCQVCTSENCCDQLTACADNEDCTCLMGCLAEGEDPDVCSNDVCMIQGNNQPFMQLRQCTNMQCGDSCMAP